MDMDFLTWARCLLSERNSTQGISLNLSDIRFKEMLSIKSTGGSVTWRFWWKVVGGVIPIVTCVLYLWCTVQDDPVWRGWAVYRHCCGPWQAVGAKSYAWILLPCRFMWQPNEARSGSLPGNQTTIQTQMHTHTVKHLVDAQSIPTPMPPLSLFPCTPSVSIPHSLLMIWGTAFIWSIT